MGAGPATADVPVDGLIGYWTGDGNANDSSPTHNDGTFAGSYVAGHTGQAFNLATGAVRIPDSPVYNFQNYSAWSVGFWFNANGPIGSATFVGQDMGAGENPKWFVDYNYANPGPDNSFILHLNNYGSTPRVFLSSSQVAVPNGWNQLSVVVGSGEVKFYFNGQFVGSQAYTGIIPDPVADLVFGDLEGCCQFGGVLDDIVIYNRALTADDIEAITGGVIIPEPPEPPVTSHLLDLEGLPANQANVAEVVNSGMSDAAWRSVFGPLVDLSHDLQYEALSQLSGEAANAAAIAGFEQSQAFLDQTLSRRQRQPGFTVWGAAPAGWSNLTSGRFGSHSTNVSRGALVLGADYVPFAGSMIGLAAGMGQSWWNAHDRMGRGRGDAVQFGLYGAQSFGDVGFSAALGIGELKAKTVRSVEYGGGAEYGGEFDVFGESFAARVDLRLVDNSEASLVPYLGIHGTQLHLPHFTESTAHGTPLFALSYGKRAEQDFGHELGIAITQTLEDLGPNVTVGGQVGWEHSYRTTPFRVAEFDNWPGSDFTVHGASLPSDAARLSVEAEARFYGISFAAKWQSSIAPTAQSHGGNVSMAYQW